MTDKIKTLWDQNHERMGWVLLALNTSLFVGDKLDQWPYVTAQVIVVSLVVGARWLPRFRASASGVEVGGDDD